MIVYVSSVIPSGESIFPDNLSFLSCAFASKSSKASEVVSVVSLRPYFSPESV